MTDVATSPDQLASARQAWITAGHDVAKFDAALAGTAAPAAKASAALMGSALSAEQARQAAAQLTAAGVPADEVDKALQADGFAPAPAADTSRSELEVAFDNSSLAPAQKPEDYRINWVGRVDGMQPSEVAEMDKEARTFLAATGFPPDIGVALVEMIRDEAQKYQAMTEVERALWKQEQNVLLDRLTRGDRQLYMDVATATLRKADPAYVAKLVEGGGLHSAATVMHLAMQGDRLQARERLRGKKA